MDSPMKVTTVVVCSAILALTFLSGCVTSFAYDEDFPSDDYDILPVPIGKRSHNPFCRRCLIHRDEWMSCNLCYGRPRGIVPYFGKRSLQEEEEQDRFYEDEGDDDEGRRTATDDDDLELRMVDKRARGSSGAGGRGGSFLDMRCCGALGIRECCRRSIGKRAYNTIFFPDEGTDQLTWKRDYDSSLVPPLDRDNDLCSCCDEEEEPLFQLSPCCSLTCAKRK